MYNTRRVVHCSLGSDLSIGYISCSINYRTLTLRATGNEKSRVALFLFLSGSFLQFILELRRFFPLFGDRCSGGGAKKKRETRSGSSRRTSRWRSRGVYVYIFQLFIKDFDSSTRQPVLFDPCSTLLNLTRSRDEYIYSIHVYIQVR